MPITVDRPDPEKPTTDDRPDQATTYRLIQLYLPCLQSIDRSYSHTTLDALHEQVSRPPSLLIWCAVVASTSDGQVRGVDGPLVFVFAVEETNCHYPGWSFYSLSKRTCHRATKPRDLCTVDRVGLGGRWFCRYNSLSGSLLFIASATWTSRLIARIIYEDKTKLHEHRQAMRLSYITGFSMWDVLHFASINQRLDANRSCELLDSNT